MPWSFPPARLNKNRFEKGRQAISGVPQDVVAIERATTILFTDIEDSTVLVETLGDRRWLDLLRLHNTIVRERIAEHRGYEVKTVGDGFMVAFSSPDAAVACAAGIQRALSGTR